jgi:hypothetical protein
MWRSILKAATLLLVKLQIKAGADFKIIFVQMAARSQTAFLAPSRW